MTYDNDLQHEIDPQTTLHQFRCELCDQIIEYEEFSETPVKRICCLCEFKESHTGSELAELMEKITELKKYRKSDYLLVEDAVYFWYVYKNENNEGIKSDR